MLAHVIQHLPSTMNALRTLSVGLVAVTMPYKNAILPYLDSLSMEIDTVQAVNTVICREGKLTGYNTDIDGIAYALRHVALADKRVLLIGAGGAACAAAYYLKKNQAELLWLNRTVEHVFPLIEKFGGTLLNAADLKQVDIDIIINTTPLGMFPHLEHSALPHYHFNQNQIVFDMIYNPHETLLLKQAKSQGAVCISGLEMFVGQGLKQIELWLNKSILTSALVDLVKNKINQSLELV
jgi:shikimate dehydrogenase